MTTEELRDAYFGAVELGQPRDKGLRAVADAAERRVLAAVAERIDRELWFDPYECSRDYGRAIAEVEKLVEKMREEDDRANG
jgi:hypothetical protein